MSSDTNLRRLSAAASMRPFFLGHVIERYVLAAGVEHTSLLSDLECDEDTFQRLCLCRAPRIENTKFVDETKLIASKYRLNLGSLMQILRDVAVSESMAAESHRTNGGWLMAARDRIDSDDPE